MGPVIPLICEHLARIAVLQGVLFLCMLLFLKPKYCKGYLTNVIMHLCSVTRTRTQASRPGRQGRKRGKHVVIFEATFYNITTEETEKQSIIFDAEIIDEGDTDFEEMRWKQAIMLAMNIVKENNELSLDSLEFISC